MEAVLLVILVWTCWDILGFYADAMPCNELYCIVLYCYMLLQTFEPSFFFWEANYYFVRRNDGDSCQSSSHNYLKLHAPTLTLYTSKVLLFGPFCRGKA